jgi:hypothetical protein
MQAWTLYEGAADIRTLSQLLPGANKVVNALGLLTKAFIAGLVRKDGLRGQNLNMVLTIITINSSYSILFLICSQINNNKSLITQCFADKLYYCRH